MREPRLDNPFWHALCGPHQHWAQGSGALRWYPQDVLPFLAVASPQTQLQPYLPQQLGLGAAAYFFGTLPQHWPPGWRVHSHSLVLQMDFPGPPPPAGPLTDPVLGVADRPAMLRLASVAFPDFFRARSAELGTFLGVHADSQLVAMAGERVALDGYQEISGICTDPAFTGRGYARRLTLALLRRHEARGVRSFLHVSSSNLAARRLYESLGFAAIAELPLVRIEADRTAAPRRRGRAPALRP